jgi:hypothetical protein
MARALECPACGARHRLDGIPDSPTFRCDRCGQVLKAPGPVSTGGPPPPPRRAGGDPASVAPPPRRRDPAAAEQTVAEQPSGDPATRVAPVSTAAAVSATVSAAGPAEEATNGSRRGRAPKPAMSTPKSKRVSWYWRLVAWVVAVPLGFVITAWPAYELGFIKKNDVLDIFVGTGVGRWVRLAIATAVWALVTALLVQLFVEGGRSWAARRRTRTTVPA